MCSYSTLQTKRPQPVHCIDPLQMATTFNTLMCHPLPCALFPFARSVFSLWLYIFNLFPRWCLHTYCTVSVRICTQTYMDTLWIHTRGRGDKAEHYMLHINFILFCEVNPSGKTEWLRCFCACNCVLCSLLFPEMHSHHCFVFFYVTLLLNLWKSILFQD